MKCEKCGFDGGLVDGSGDFAYCPKCHSVVDTIGPSETWTRRDEIALAVFAQLPGGRLDIWKSFANDAYDAADAFLAEKARRDGE